MLCYGLLHLYISLNSTRSTKPFHKHSSLRTELNKYEDATEANTTHEYVRTNSHLKKWLTCEMPYTSLNANVASYMVGFGDVGV